MARRESDVYQVDLIAALFGGFMIIWLASTKEIEFFREPNELIFATLDMSVAGKFNLHDITLRKSALPILNISNFFCAHHGVLSELDDSVDNFKTCITSSFNMQKQEASLNNLMQEAKEDCALHRDLNKSPNVYSTFITASLFDIEIIGLDSKIYSGILDRTNSKVDGVEDYSNRFFGPSLSSFGVLNTSEKCVYKHRLSNPVLSFVLSDKDVDNINNSIDIRIKTTKGANLYQLYNSIGKSDGYLSKEYEALNPSGQHDLTGTNAATLESPVLQVKLCIHKASGAICFEGKNGLKKDQTITLNKNS